MSSKWMIVPWIVLSVMLGVSLVLEQWIHALIAYLAMFLVRSLQEDFMAEKHRHDQQMYLIREMQERRSKRQ